MPADRLELLVPARTLIKIAIFVLLALMIVRLRPVILMLVVALLLAVVLDATVSWLERRRVGRRIARAGVAIALLGLVFGVLFGLIPAVASELSDLRREAPRIVQQLGEQFPAARPYIADLVPKKQAPSPPQVKQILTRGLVAGRYALEALAAIFLTLVIAIYLLIEGKRAFEWLAAFASPPNRAKLHQTASEVRPVVLAYMKGQLITSTLSGAVALVTLLVLKVPAAFVLAILAFVGDFIPVVGTIAATVPAAGLALLQSPAKALIVIGVYSLYNLIESYWIIPRIYGNQLRLSTLVVLIAVTIGGVLQGPIGTILILPFVAAYPIVERIWLEPWVGRRTITTHEAIESAD